MLYRHIYIYIYIYIYTYILAYIHTYIHTYIRTYMWSLVPVGQQCTLVHLGRFWEPWAQNAFVLLLRRMPRRVDAGARRDTTPVAW